MAEPGRHRYLVQGTLRRTDRSIACAGRERRAVVSLFWPNDRSACSFGRPASRPYMKVLLSTGLSHSLLRSCLTLLGYVVRVRGYRFSQLRLRHLTCGRAAARTKMPHARSAAPARRDQPETRRHYTAKDENGGAPLCAAGQCYRGDSWLFMRRPVSPPGSLRQPESRRSLYSARVRLTACAPWPQWRFAACVRLMCRRARGTTLLAPCQAGSG